MKMVLSNPSMINLSLEPLKLVCPTMEWVLLKPSSTCYPPNPINMMLTQLQHFNILMTRFVMQIWKRSSLYKAHATFCWPKINMLSLLLLIDFLFWAYFDLVILRVQTYAKDLLVLSLDSRKLTFLTFSIDLHRWTSITICDSYC
jgi:hypothetical protein